MKLWYFNYDVGIQFSQQYTSRPEFDPKVMHRELEIIKSDLLCNAARISRTDPNRFVNTQGSYDQILVFL